MFGFAVQRWRTGPRWMGTGRPTRTFEALLEHVKDQRAFDFTGYKRSSLMRRVDRRMDQVGVTSYADYLDLAGRPRRVHRAVQHDPDQRHRLLPRPRRLGRTCARDVLPALLASKPAEPADPGVERRLRVRRGGLHPGDRAGRAARARTSSATGSRSTPPTSTRRRSPTPGRPPTPSASCAASRRSCSSGTSSRTGGRYVFRKDLRRVGDLRPQRPRAGRPDLADRPARRAATR